MSEIETAILNAIGEKKQLKKEDRQAYLVRLTKAADAFFFPTDESGETIDCSEEADEAWEALEEPTQLWINKAVKLEDGDEIPDFPDIETEDDETETETKETEEKNMALRDDSDDEETSVKTTKKTAKKGATKTAKADKAPAKKAAAKTVTKGKDKPAVTKGKTSGKSAKASSGRPARRTDGKPSGYTMIREIMRKDTNTKLADLIASLEKKGYSLSANATAVIRTNFLATIRELSEAGCIKGISMPD